MPTSSAGLVRRRLPILGKVGEHRKQHEAADEREGIVEAERIQPAIDGGRAGDAAVAIDRGRANVFDALEQRIAAVCANDVAQQPAEIADVRILRDRRGHLAAL